MENELNITNNNYDEKLKKLRKTVLICITVLYFILLIWTIVFKCNNNESLHIARNRSKTIIERLEYSAIPFQRTFNSLKEGSKLEILAFIFNIIGFFPMTILFRYLKFNRLNSVLIAASISMIIEIFQLFTGWGGFDISDWILNVLGALLGIGIFELYSKLSYKVQYIIIAIFGIVTIPVDIYAIINTILNFPN